jgi:hypothetical protein
VAFTDDAPARLGHFFIRRARQPHGELVGALAAVDQVRVAIHQAGRGKRAARIPAAQRVERLLVLGGQPGLWPRPHHAAALHHHAGEFAGRHWHIGHH